LCPAVVLRESTGPEFMHVSEIFGIATFIQIFLIKKPMRDYTQEADTFTYHKQRTVLQEEKLNRLDLHWWNEKQIFK
jgi:hypothetical protein